ncbi:indolepyruvate ferredoxin oxidoreductase [bacterium]|nr:indolepyruvate ferredoxin oxidoreductase [candidate division CSSED10-310 bacterium]
MTRQLVLGDEAVALAAVHAGISGAYSYPGTPATEIFESVHKMARKHDIHAVWSTNEKVAMEEALGMSYAGKRAIVSMKHVGLNVAADPFMNSGNTGANGGIVVAVADDPGMHSSQNEQDTRYYGQFAQIPVFEPSTQQEAYDLTRLAFEFSERYQIPVLLRLVTRLSHSRADITVSEPRPQNEAKWPENLSSWTLLPSNARIALKELVAKQEHFLRLSEESDYNRLVLNPNNKKLGVIASGIAYNYVMESLSGEDAPSILKISIYPLPVEKIRKLVDHVAGILVIEDGYPFIESQLKGMFGIPGTQIFGRLSGHLPRTGEMNPDLVWEALGNDPRPNVSKPSEVIASRPPSLCVGCPHIDSYKALNEALSVYREPKVFADIGCYTLGFYPPYNAIHSCVDMGASVGMAVGAAHAGVTPAVAAIGDSTFSHSGITPLIDAIKQDVPVTVVILDNSTVAMTGFQPTQKTGNALHDMLVGLGADPGHIKIIEPLPRNHDENVRIIRKELAHGGLSIILAQRLCVQIARRHSK